MNCPTLLRMPSWLGVGVHEELELPHWPGDYKVTPGARWTVTSLKTGGTVYAGSGLLRWSGRLRRSEEPQNERARIYCRLWKRELFGYSTRWNLTTICDMKEQHVTEWESQWTSQHRREQIATQRAELEQVRHQVGWRRNYVILASLVIALSLLLLHHFS